MKKEIFYKLFFGKEFRAIGLCILMLYCSFGNSYAQTQTKTAYEKKVAEITAKYFKIFLGYNRELTMAEKVQVAELTDGESAGAFLYMGIMSYADTHSESQVKSMLKQMEYDFKQAEKLKTSVDFQREKLKKEKEAQERYLRTDKGQIESNIKTSFEKWNTKSEFEKQTDYETRLQNDSQNSFSQICTEQIKSKINKYLNLNKELLPYNVDNEYFMIKFKNAHSGIKWESKLNISIANAEKLKNNWREFETEINQYDWCFVNDTLYPTSVTLLRTDGYGENKKIIEQYTLPVTVENQNEISIPFDKLKIENQFLKGYVFKYSDAKAMEEKIAYEKFVADSLELISLNHKLDSAFQNYNNQLLANKYNNNKKVVAEFSKIEKINDYNKSLSNLKRNFDNIENELKKRELFVKDSICDVYQQKLDGVCNEYVRKLKTMKTDFENHYNTRNYGTFFNGKMNEITKNRYAATDGIGNGWTSKNFYPLKDGNCAENYDKALERMSQLFAEFQQQVIEIKKQVIQQKMTEPISNSSQWETERKNQKRLNKEWDKNGKYFADEIEFYEAFISVDYKEILQGKQKK
jgi:hypothetical protein